MKTVPINELEGNWKQIKGNVMVIIGKLLDDQAMMSAGKRQQLAGRIQEDYGITITRAERQLSQWSNTRY